jgi:DNA-binding NtrC family response regulator
MGIVKENYPHTQFIMLTGFGDDEIEKAVSEGGGFGYLNKPLNPVVLEDTIRAAFEKLSEISSIEESIQSMLEQTDIPTKYALRRTFEVIGGLVISPLLGLAFVVFLPAVGFAALIYHVGDQVRYYILGGEST